jgi:hypothetical protein
MSRIVIVILIHHRHKPTDLVYGRVFSLTSNLKVWVPPSFSCLWLAVQHIRSMEVVSSIRKLEDAACLVHQVKRDELMWRVTFDKTEGYARTIIIWYWLQGRGPNPYNVLPHSRKFSFPFFFLHSCSLVLVWGSHSKELSVYDSVGIEPSPLVTDPNTQEYSGGPTNSRLHP